MLQFLESEIFGLKQGSLAMRDYFTKVKSLAREISLLDPKNKVGEDRIRRKIIHELQPEYRSFTIAVQGWPTQPTLEELENMLADEEALNKQKFKA